MTEPIILEKHIHVMGIWFVRLMLINIACMIYLKEWSVAFSFIPPMMLVYIFTKFGSMRYQAQIGKLIDFPIDRVCPICLNELYNYDDLKRLKCCDSYGHTNHLNEWFSIRNVCPRCKTPKTRLFR